MSGMQRMADEMQACLDEAKQADQQHTELAANLLRTAVR